MAIKFFRGGNSITLFEVKPIETFLSDSLLEIPYIIIRFTTPSPVDLTLGDYVIVDSVRYQLFVYPDYKIDNGDYYYDIQLFHSNHIINHKIFTKKGTSISTFKIVGNLKTVLDLWVWNINKTQENPFGVDTGWSTGKIPNTPLREIQFTGINCFDVLKKLTEVYYLEFSINSKKVSFSTKIETDTIINLNTEDVVKAYKLNHLENFHDFYTRAYIRGGNKNIPKEYQDESFNFKPPFDYFQELSSHNEVKETKKYFKDEYPHYILPIKNKINYDSSLFLIEVEKGFSNKVKPNTKIVFLNGVLEERLFNFDYDKETNLIKIHFEYVSNAQKSQINIGDLVTFTNYEIPQKEVEKSLKRLHDIGLSWFNNQNFQLIRAEISFDKSFYNYFDKLIVGSKVVFTYGGIPYKNVRLVKKLHQLETNGVVITITNHSEPEKVIQSVTNTTIEKEEEVIPNNPPPNETTQWVIDNVIPLTLSKINGIEDKGSRMVKVIGVDDTDELTNKNVLSSFNTLKKIEQAINSINFNLKEPYIKEDDYGNLYVEQNFYSKKGLSSYGLGVENQLYEEEYALENLPSIIDFDENGRFISFTESSTDEVVIIETSKYKADTQYKVNLIAQGGILTIKYQGSDESDVIIAQDYTNDFLTTRSNSTVESITVSKDTKVYSLKVTEVNSDTGGVFALETLGEGNVITNLTKLGETLTATKSRLGLDDITELREALTTLGYGGEGPLVPIGENLYERSYLVSNGWSESTGYVSMGNWEIGSYIHIIDASKFKENTQYQLNYKVYLGSNGYGDLVIKYSDASSTELIVHGYGEIKEGAYLTTENKTVDWIAINYGSYRVYDDTTCFELGVSDVPVPGGPTRLSELTDVTLTNLQDEQILKWNGSKWINGDISVVNNLTSTSTTSALSAYQGTVLNQRIDNIAGGGGEADSVLWGNVIGRPTKLTQFDNVDSGFITEADIIRKADTYYVNNELALKLNTSVFDSHVNNSTDVKHLTSLQHSGLIELLTNGGLTQGQRDILNLFEIVDGNLKVSTTFYSTKGLSAFGLGVGSDTPGTGGEIISLEQIGNGNAVTSISKQGSILTITKGNTFALQNDSRFHTHSNKSILDGISSSDISNWDNKASENHTHTKSEITDFPTRLKQFTNDLGNYGDWATTLEVVSALNQKLNTSVFDSHVLEFNSHLSEYSTHVSEYNSHLSDFNSHVTTFNNHLSDFSSHVSDFNIHVADKEAHFDEGEHDHLKKLIASFDVDPQGNVFTTKNFYSTQGVSSFKLGTS